MNEREFEIYKVTPETISSWIEEIMLNKKLLKTISRSKGGPVMELRFIFRDGPQEERNFKNVEQWTSVPCKLPKEG